MNVWQTRIMRPSPVVFDTNIWIFGLRHQPDRPACAVLLAQLRRLTVLVPRQVFRELLANLTDEERGVFFRLLSELTEHVEVHWEFPPTELVQEYRERGCKPGDAAVAAQVEALKVDTLVSENRDFLLEMTNLPFRVIRAEDLVRELRAGPGG